MNTILVWSFAAAQTLLALAMACATFRMLYGPRAQDRIVGFDALYANAMLLLVTFGMRSGGSVQTARHMASMRNAWWWVDTRQVDSLPR